MMTLETACLAALMLAVGPATADGPDAILGEKVVYVYQPEGRRDPFVKPHFGDGEGRPDCSGSGLAGLLLGDTPLHGIVLTRDGPVAMLVGRDGTAYFGRVGDRLCDGTIAAIEPDKVVYSRKAISPPARPGEQRVEVRLWPSAGRSGSDRR